MGLKKFEIEVEVITIREVVVYAEDFAEAVVKSKSIKRDETDDGELMDWELRVIGVRRTKDSRMYQ